MILKTAFESLVLFQSDFANVIHGAVRQYDKIFKLSVKIYPVYHVLASKPVAFDRFRSYKIEVVTYI